LIYCKENLKSVLSRPQPIFQDFFVKPTEGIQGVPQCVLYYFPILLADLNLRLNSGPNIIYLPEPLPAVIYLPAPLPNIIYVLPDYRELLPSPKSYLALPESKQLLNITAPISYPALKAPIEELNIIYILPKVFYMEPPLPSMFYLPGKIQACLPAPTIIRAPPYPEVNPTLPKPLCEKPDLPKVIYIEPSLPNMIHLPGKVSVLRDNHFKFIRILLILLLICIKDF